MSILHKILHERLGVWKLCARWILHLLTDAQKKLVQLWCIQNCVEKRPIVSLGVSLRKEANKSFSFSSRSIKKQTVTCLFMKTIHEATAPFKNQKIVNSE